MQFLDEFQLSFIACKFSPAPSTIATTFPSKDIQLSHGILYSSLFIDYNQTERFVLVCLQVRIIKGIKLFLSRIITLNRQPTFAGVVKDLMDIWQQIATVKHI